MDEIDSNQQKQIDRLEDHAKENKTTDFAQWLTLACLGLSLLAYINMVLVSVINNQASTIQAITQKCR